MRTYEQFYDKLMKMRPNNYMHGRLVPRDDPLFMTGLKMMGLTFTLANDPEYKDLMQVKSHLTGETINRFNHINQSTEDLESKQKMVRRLCQGSGRCIQRCMGCDAMNALSVVTKDTDLAHGTNYHERFLKFLQYYQENDLVASCAQTDTKGDRSLRPFEQKDPDQYLRVVEKREDGIIVRGAKAHNTIAPYADEIIVIPSRALTKQDADYAVAFSIPADAEGIYLISMAHNMRKRSHFHAPIENFGIAHSIAIFEDVFVPWERVFLCGETKEAGQLAAMFATYHRHSYTGCKSATTDILMGATALAAEYLGVEKTGHVRDKLAHMVSIAELIFAAGLAASLKGTKTASGTYVPNVVYTNIGRYHAGTNIMHEFETIIDIAGGLVATLPYEEDFLNPETKDMVEKYIKRKFDVPTENVNRCYRLIEDLVASAAGGASQVSGIHGGGSPIMEKIAIMANYDINSKKNIAKHLAGIEK